MVSLYKLEQKTICSSVAQPTHSGGLTILILRAIPSIQSTWPFQSKFCAGYCTLTTQNVVRCSTGNLLPATGASCHWQPPSLCYQHRTGCSNLVGLRTSGTSGQVLQDRPPNAAGAYSWALRAASPHLSTCHTGCAPY
jgi:hypothetical protein